MNCHEALQHVQRFLDGTGTLDDEYQEHLGSCTHCLAQANSAQALKESLATRPPLQLRACLVDQIVRQELRRRLFARRSRHLLAASVIAVIVLGGLRTFTRLQVPQEGLLSGSGNSVSAVPGARTPEGPAPLASRTPQPGVLPASFDWRQVVEPPARSLAEAGQSLAETLEPVAGSTLKAVDLLLRDPVRDTNPKGG